jgi:hypothetical protein
VPRTGVMSVGGAPAAVVVADAEVLEEAVESCAAGELSCFAHPASTSSAAENVETEVSVALVAASDIWRIVKLL